MTGLDEAQLRWVLDAMIQRGMPPNQASAYLAQLTGVWPYPGNAAVAEYATDAGADVYSGNTVTLTPSSPVGSLMFPGGQRASGNKVLNLTFDVTRVEYNRQIPGPPQTVYKRFVKGRCAFGAGGGGHTVEFDIKNGIQVSLIGQGPQISVEMEDAEDPASPSSITVSASMGVGTRAARAFNTRTFPGRVIPPGQSLFCKVPHFAYAFMPYADDPAAIGPGATSVQGWGYGGDCAYAVGGLYGVPVPPILVTGELLVSFSGSDFAGAHLTEGLKLPGGLGLITITNNLLTPVEWTPSFALAI